MATSSPDNVTGTGTRGPAWASALGVIAIVLGVFLTAYHSNEVMKQAVLVNAMPASGEMPAADCPEDELEEEGISLAECEYMVDHIGGLFLSMPDWFPAAHMWLAVAGAILAFLSIVVGGALVNYHPSASTAAVAVFVGLTLVDALQFAVVVNTGPILRDVYLWNILLWLTIHIMMTTGVIAGRHHEAEA